MDKLMLDGNAVAGLLQEVFAAEMTSASIDGAAMSFRRDIEEPHTSAKLGTGGASTAAREIS